jgi:hypothetical protein
LDQTSWEYRYQNTGPNNREQKVDQGSGGKVKHGSMRGQENDARFGKSVLSMVSIVRNLLDGS